MHACQVSISDYCTVYKEGWSKAPAFIPEEVLRKETGCETPNELVRTESVSSFRSRRSAEAMPGNDERGQEVKKKFGPPTLAEFEREQYEAAVAREAEAAALAAANRAAFGEAMEEDEDESSVEDCMCSLCSCSVYDGGDFCDFCWRPECGVHSCACVCDCEN